MASRVNCVEELMAVLGDAASERDAVLGVSDPPDARGTWRASRRRARMATGSPTRGNRYVFWLVSDALAHAWRWVVRLSGGEARVSGAGGVTCGTVRKEFVFGQKHVLAIKFYGSLSSPTFLDPDRWA